MLQKYLENIFKTSKAGDAREESYYFALKSLIEDWSKEKLFVTTLPKQTEGGNPDFRIWNKDGEIVGYIEAKDPKVENLDSIEKSEQLKRYLSTFPNVILTNFFEFRLYRNGELTRTVSVGRPFIIHELKTTPPAENENDFIELLTQFTSFSIPKSTTAKALALELAKRTRFLRDNIISEELREENKEGMQVLESYYKAFKEHLISSLDTKTFSDLFAQTITYGLFAARSRSDENFIREAAYKNIPPTIGILRDVFRFISSSELPEQMEWIIDDIAEVLARADVKSIIENFYKEGKGNDPIVHFYETFLTEYDPKERAKRGVYYTPEPVVSYIVRSINILLKEKFGKEDGFATPSVTVLDPASGTLTFPVEAIRLAVKEYKSKYGDGGVSNLISDHILKNFYAFELMMAPYAIGHLKIGFVLEELGHKLKDDERFQLYLTNSLDFTKEDPNQFPGIFEQTIAKESQDALKVKEEVPVMVVMGNPPYSVSSSNILKEGTDFYKLYESYKENVRKEEKNIQPLSDDYIKFIAFAHWKIKQTGQGIVGLITNNSYLDGLIHRDMRKKLLEDFDELYILNLHGSSKRKEKTSEGGKDENVFDIQQGVSIILLVKNKNLNKLIKYSDLWGTRDEKYEKLANKDLTTIDSKNLQSETPHYFFAYKNFEGSKQFESFVSLKDIFSSTGVKTHRDNFILASSKDDLKKRLAIFTNREFTDEMVVSSLTIKNTQTWNFNEIRRKLFETTLDEKLFKQYSYRPFDDKWIYYSKDLIDRTREKILWEIDDKNPAIIVTRQLSNLPFQHVFVTNNTPDICLLSLQTKESAYVFPLYYNYETNQQSFFRESGRSINFKWGKLGWLETLQSFTSSLSGNYIQVAEAIFYYIYAILYSNIYRTKYQEFLKIDFPRIPFTKDYELFKRFSEFGELLVNLHLLKSEQLNSPVSRFSGMGESNVEKREYSEVEERIYINDTQFFENVASEVWNYYIGGYQVLDKWLKDRKGKILSSEDIKHYCKVVSALSKTIKLQKEIDKLYPEVEKSLI